MGQRCERLSLSFVTGGCEAKGGLHACRRHGEDERKRALF
jgi:hypothetical protein